MIEKMTLSSDDYLQHITVTYNNKEGDYMVEIPEKIARIHLIELVDEIKRLTQIEE